MWKQAMLLGLAFILEACAPRIQAISGDAIGQVQADIRRQIDVYVRASQLPPWYVANNELVELPHDAAQFHCGRGNISYDISSVRAELTVSNSNTAGLSLGGTIPVQPVTTVEVGANGSFVRSNAQTLRYNLWPFERSEVPAAPERPPQSPPFDYNAPQVRALRDEIARAPIADVLLNLRNQQIISALKVNPVTGVQNSAPVTCFTNYDPIDALSAPGNYYEISLTIKDEGGGKVTVGVGPISIGGTFSSSVTSGNTLTVNFQQPGLERVQIAAELVTAACKGVARLSRSCSDARLAFREEVEGTGLGLNRVLAVRRQPGGTNLPNPHNTGTGVLSLPGVRLPSLMTR